VMLAPGRRLPDGSVSIDLAHPLVREHRFLIQDRDLTPWHLASSQWIGHVVTHELAPSGRDLFVVAHFPKTVHPLLEEFGVGGIAAFADPAPPETFVGNTYYSADGGASFFQTPLDAYFGLVVARR
jgi:hypothetical protein